MLVVVAMIAVVVGGVATLIALRLQSGTKLEAARRQRALLLDEGRRDAEATRREAAIESREQAVRLRAELESELRERRDAVVKTQERVELKPPPTASNRQTAKPEALKRSRNSDSERSCAACAMSIVRSLRAIA